MDINEEKSNKEFSFREKLSLRVLIMIFEITFPFKYDHQFQEFKRELLKQKE